jgi:hypothetical protein
MIFEYKAQDKGGASRNGTVEAASVEAAITTVEERGYTVSSIVEVKQGFDLMNLEIEWFQRVSNKELVILSRQIATLFQAQVSALRVFRLLGAEASNPLLKKTLNSLAEELQSGSSISRAMSLYPDIFSKFYISLVRAGEESGSLEKSFAYLADYLDRMYQVVTKARNALVYPAFVIFVFFVVMFWYILDMGLKKLVGSISNTKSIELEHQRYNQYFFQTFAVSDGKSDGVRRLPQPPPHRPFHVCKTLVRHPLRLPQTPQRIANYPGVDVIG